MGTAKEPEGTGGNWRDWIVLDRDVKMVQDQLLDVDQEEVINTDSTCATLLL